MRFFVALILLLPFVADAAVPSTNKVPWTPGVYVGVPTGIVARTTVYTNHLASYGSAALETALANCPANQIVQCETNVKHWITNTLDVLATYDHKTLRGGLNCVFHFTNSSEFNLGTDAAFAHTSPTISNFVISAVHKGTTNIVVTNVTGFAAGMMCRIAIANDTNAVFSAGAGGFLRQELKRIHAVSGNTVTVWPPIYSGYEAGSIKVCWLIPDVLEYFGIEDIYIEHTNNSAFAGLEFLQCYGSWASNVVVTNFANHGVFIYESAQCEFRNNFVRKRTGDGSNGSGYLVNASSACLIEDSVLANVFPLVEFWNSASGNVVGYNMMYGSIAFGFLGSGLNFNHGGWSEFNLLEGNLTPNIQTDGYFNGSSYNTIYRNWAYGFGPATVEANNTNSFANSFCRGSRYEASVGNIWGSILCAWPIDSMGNANIGGLPNVGVCDPINGDWWTNFSAIGVVTNRTDNDTTEIQMLDPTRLSGIPNNHWPVSVGSVSTPVIDVLGGGGYLGVYAIQMTLTNLNSVTGNLTLENHNAGNAVFPPNGTLVRLFFGNGGYQELDLSVSNTLYRAENYYFPTSVGIPAEQQTGGLTDGNSLYRTAKHGSWPTQYDLGAIDPTDVPSNWNLTNYIFHPAHYAFINGEWPTNEVAGGGPSGTNQPPLIRTLKFSSTLQGSDDPAGPWADILALGEARVDVDRGQRFYRSVSNIQRANQ